jgi:pSer/pThr/pTyr-binding forkhead associated (FHA) protein
VAELKDGDVVLLGKHEISVGINLVKGLEASERRFKALPGESIDATVALEKPRAGSTGRAEPVHKLVVSKPTHRSCPLAAFQTWIGKSDVNDIVVKGFGIAHRHLLVYWDGTQHHACDLTGKRRVKVNKAGIDDTVLKPGDLISLGALEIEYR